MNSLRSPLHIPFTYQFVCAPVGAHSLPFTCFASHTLSFLTRSYFIPPNPFFGVRYTHILFYWGSAAAYCFCSPAGRCGLIGLSCFLQLIQCLQSLHFSQSFLIPSTQPLSAPHTRVAHSLHYTSQHSSIPQYGCLTFNWYLVDESRCQILQHEQQPLIASLHPNKRFVPFNRYPCISRP